MLKVKVSSGVCVGLLLCGSLGLAGCEKATQTPSATEETHEHAHASEGPHGGSLIELGNEEYHAELVHDEKAGSVTIYVLDSAAKVEVPIEANEVTLNLTHDGNAEQFSLTAKPDASGKASKFESIDAELASELDHAEAVLVLKINGTQYRGEVHHDHDGHDHDEDHAH